MAQIYLYHVYVMFKEKSYKEEMDNFFFFFKELSRGEFASLLVYIDSKSSTWSAVYIFLILFFFF